MPFCPICGREVRPDVNFCTSCGVSLKTFTQPTAPPQVSPMPTYSPPPPPPPPQVAYQPAPQPWVAPQPMPQQWAAPSYGERAVGVIDSVKQYKSFGRLDAFTLVLTTHRMIVARLTGDVMKSATAMATEQAKAQGKGFFGQWAAGLGQSFGGYARRYLQMEPGSILAETPGNFAIDNNSISEIKLKIKEERRGQGVVHSEFEIEIESGYGKQEFRMDMDDNSVNMLKQVYGDRVKMPFGYFHGMHVKIGL